MVTKFDEWDCDINEDKLILFYHGKKVDDIPLDSVCERYLDLNSEYKESE